MRGVGLGVVDFSRSLTAWVRKLSSSGLCPRGFGTVSPTAVAQTVAGWGGWGPWWLWGPSWHTQESWVEGSPYPLIPSAVPSLPFTALGRAVPVHGVMHPGKMLSVVPLKKAPGILGPKPNFFSRLWTPRNVMLLTFSTADPLTGSWVCLFPLKSTKNSMVSSALMSEVVVSGCTEPGGRYRSSRSSPSRHWSGRLPSGHQQTLLCWSCGVVCVQGVGEGVIDRWAGGGGDLGTHLYHLFFDWTGSQGSSCIGWDQYLGPWAYYRVWRGPSAELLLYLYQGSVQRRHTWRKTGWL